MSYGKKGTGRVGQSIRTEEVEEGEKEQEDNISPVIFEVQPQSQCSSKWEIKYDFIFISEFLVYCVFHVIHGVTVYISHCV